MKPLRHATGGGASRRIILRFAPRAAPLILRLLALRAVLAPREQPLCRFSDRRLADIGLTRADVARPGEGTVSAELEIQRLLRGHGWR